MLSKSTPKSKTDEVDSGMNGLDAYFATATPRQAETPGLSAETVKQLVQEQVQTQVKAQIQQMTPAAAKTPTKSAKKTVLTHKEGLYFSELVSERLDQEWKQQPRRQQKSKSLLVEEILRQYWGLPPLDA